MTTGRTAFTDKQEFEAYQGWLVSTGRSKTMGDPGGIIRFRERHPEVYRDWVNRGRPTAGGEFLSEARPGVDPIQESMLGLETQRGIDLFGAAAPTAESPEAFVRLMQGLTGEQVAQRQGVIQTAEDAVTGDGGAFGIPELPTTPLPPGFEWDFDASTRSWIPVRSPRVDPGQEAQFRFQTEQQELQLESQREERLAQLAARPISWLQHAALSGKPPVVQPWMIPLMRPGQNLQVGQTIPGDLGFGGDTQQQGFLPGTATPQPLGARFENLPSLRRPSAQLFARFGPTAQQELLGFRQARTGIPPEEALFRQRQGGPPGGGGGAFTQQRLRV